MMRPSRTGARRRFRNRDKFPDNMLEDVLKYGWNCSYGPMTVDGLKEIFEEIIGDDHFGEDNWDKIFWFNEPLSPNRHVEHDKRTMDMFALHYIDGCTIMSLIDYYGLCGRSIRHYFWKMWDGLARLAEEQRRCRSWNPETKTYNFVTGITTRYYSGRPTIYQYIPIDVEKMNDYCLEIISQLDKKEKELK